MPEALGLAASVVTVVDLFVKVGVLCSVYCASLKTARHEARSILKEADRFTLTLKDVEQLLIGPNGAKIEASQSVKCSIADCRLQLDDLAAKLEQGTRWKRMTWPLKKEEVADIVKKLGRYRDAIALDLQVNQMALLCDVHQEIILAKLRIAEGATFDSHTEADNARCHPGTRVDILQQISAWGTSRDGESIFWLNGMAGTGKSTISRTISQSFAEKGILGASFFFKRGEGDRGRTISFFTTIIAQLVHQLPALAPHVHAAVEANPAINEKSATDQFDKLIADPIRKLPGLSRPPAMVIVVDALDECDTLEHIRRIIQLLSQAKSFTSIRLRFFLTSRPELPIRLGFEEISGKYKDLVLHQIPKPIIEHDITAFLQHELSKIQKDYNKSVTPNRQLPLDWPGAKHIHDLVDMAIPLFIFAATVCRFIQDRRLGSPKDQLARLLEHQGNQKSNLDATYLPVLNQLLTGLCESEKQEVAEKFKQVVGSIVILASPLSVPSLACLLGISPGAIEDQLDLLHSVLSIHPDPSVPVRLLHLSFRDFLVDPEKGREQELYPFWVNERQTHELLAAQCLKLLSTGDTLKRDVCGLRLPGKRRSEISQQTIDACLPSEVQYACRYWVYHSKESKCLIRDGDIVDYFLTRHLLHWLEALSLLGRVWESTGMVNDMLDLLDPGMSSKLSAFLRDTRRVILSHCSIIDESPLQLYYSAIVFAPEQSVVRETFRNQFPVWLSLPPQVDSDWAACLQTLEGHSISVYSVAFSHDSVQLASASSNIKLWDVSSGVCLQTLEDHGRPVKSVAFSHDSALLASASCDETVKLWDVSSGVCLQTLKDHGSLVKSVAFSHNSVQLASASLEGIVKLWNVSSGECLQTLKGHHSSLNSVVFSHDSAMLASASCNGTVKLWDTSSGKCLQTLEDHHISPVYSVAFSHNSVQLASASSNIKLWDVSSGVCLQTLEDHGSPVKSVAFSHNSVQLASASLEGTVKLWDVSSGECLQMLNGHGGSVYSVAFSHDSTLLASASCDRTVKLWDTSSSKYLQTLEDRISPVYSVAFSHNSVQLASASSNIKLWDVSSGVCLQTLEDHGRPVKSVAFSHNSALLASASYNIKLWDTSSGKYLQTLKDHSSSVKSVAFSHDSAQLASASDDGTVKLWDTSSGKCLQTLEDHGSLVYSVAFSHDSTQLASASSNIKLWDVSSGECLQKLKGHSGPVNSVAFSHDSAQLVSSSDDGTVKVWDVSSSKRPLTFEVGTALHNISFDFTNSYLLTDIGAINISILSSPGLIPPDPTPQSPQYQGLGRSVDRRWITYDSENLMWLPQEYRPSRSTVSGDIIGVGTESGKIWMCKVQGNEV